VLWLLVLLVLRLVVLRLVVALLLLLLQVDVLLLGLLEVVQHAQDAQHVVLVALKWVLASHLELLHVGLVIHEGQTLWHLFYLGPFPDLVVRLLQDLEVVVVRL